MSNSLQDFKNELAEELYGITQQEAWDQGICICCKDHAMTKNESELDKAEYLISALCGPCFDNITKESEDE